MNSSVKNVLCLSIITIVAGLGLGYVYEITKEPIARMEEATKLEAYKTVFPEASDFVDVDGISETAPSILQQAGITGVDIESASYALDASQNGLGVVINATSHEGYGGDITISVGIDNSGRVTGMEILKISETAGLGMKAREDAFKGQFANKTVTQFSYTKSGATSDFEIDAISGATITTRAVTNAVNAALSCFRSMGGQQ